MQLTVAVEALNGNGFRARSGEPLALSAEGKTQEEAVRNLEQAIQDRLAGGVRLLTLSVPPGEHPLKRLPACMIPTTPW